MSDLFVLALSQPRADDAAAGAAGALGCAGCGAFFIFIVVALIALQVSLLVWVARDAKARGMDAAVLWMIFVSPRRCSACWSTSSRARRAPSCRVRRATTSACRRPPGAPTAGTEDEAMTKAE